MPKRYFTTSKTGEEVEVDSDLAKQLVDSGKKKPEDFTIEDLPYTDQNIDSVSEVTPMQALAPNVMALPEDAGIGQTLAAYGTDILSTPISAPVALGRTIDTRMGWSGNKPQTFWESLLQIKKGKSPIGEESIVSGIVSDPSNVPLMAVGGPLYKYGAKIASKSPWFSRVLGTTLTGAGEGVVSATAHQAEKVARGEDVSLGEAGTEVGLSALAPTALEGTFKLGDKALGSLAEQLSGVKEEAMRKYGLGFGKEAKEMVKTMANREKIGEKFLGHLDNWEKYVPEGAELNRLINNVPDIESEPIAKGILDLLDKVKLKKSNKLVLNQLENYFDDFTEKDKFSASELWEKRKELDDIIPWDQQTTKVKSMIKSMRSKIENEIEKRADQVGLGEEYLAKKAAYIIKEDLKKNILRKIGKQGDQDRVNKFLSNLYGENKEGQQKLVEEISGLFGEDFAKKAKLLQLGKSLGPGGKPTLLPAQFSGRAGLGLGIGGTASYMGANPMYTLLPMGLSSPRISSGALQLSDLLQSGAEKTINQAPIKQGLRSLTFRDLTGEEQ